MSVDQPPDGDDRLKALESVDIVGSDPEPEFDEIVRRAAEACATPMALISFVTADKQWIKAAHGLNIKETSREVSFCTWAIHSADVLCVEDASQDERFRDNPLVLQSPYIRYYAGAPIPTPEGYLLGTVCVLDHKARKADAGHHEALQACSAEVAAALARRRKTAPAGPEALA